MVRHPPSRWQRVLIVGLALWGLMTIVPDLARPFWHYGTLGFEADNNGFVSDVSATIKAYPKGCIRNDDWIALNPSWHPSKDLLLVYGGMGGLQYVRKDQTANLSVAHAEDGPAHACRISAQALPKGQDNPITDHPAAEFWLPIIAAISTRDSPKLSVPLAPSGVGAFTKPGTPVKFNPAKAAALLATPPTRDTT